MSYTKLANSILTSTIWMEDDQTRIVWLTLLAMADKNGEVQASIPGLANVARVSIPSCHAAIDKFRSPDPYSRTKDDEGRRIEDIRGGWSLINHAEYRNLASDDDRKAKSAERQRRHRERSKRNNSGVTGRDKSHQIPQAEAEAEAELMPSAIESVSKPKRKQSSAAAVEDPSFIEFWDIYPRRMAKGKARKAWAIALTKADSESILVGAERFKKSKLGKPTEFIPYPSVWLNGEQWTDDSDKPKDQFPWMSIKDPEERQREHDRIFLENYNS